MSGHDTDRDRLARMLALAAGVDWDRLPDYPGYSRYYWREQAEAMCVLIARAAPPPADPALAPARAVP